MSKPERFIPIARAARILHAGGIVAYPTEAVYGIGCLPNESAALERLLEIKKRSPSKGLILIAADFEQVEAFVSVPDGPLGEEIRASWPGPVTWILPARGNVSAIVTGGRCSIAIRMTAHPIASALCAAAGGALVSTSANVSGREPITKKTRLRHQLGRSVDMIVPGELGGRARPTAIRDGGTGAVIRAD